MPALAAAVAIAAAAVAAAVCVRQSRATYHAQHMRTPLRAGLQQLAREDASDASPKAARYMAAEPPNQGDLDGQN